ncbi:universal stress protein [Empedobacter brevis]|uniref:universal stress protein n=1 Tax=Empedobacter brevis TaxID=247 RepID=UPI0039AF2DCB
MAKILFPTDFSETANNAFLYALNLAKVLKTNIKLISVQSTLKNDLDVSEDNFENYINKLKNIAKENNLEHVKIESSLIVGDILLMILDIINKDDIKYVVMGTNGQNSLGKKIFGSNTINVINNSPAPVFVVPSKVKFKVERNFAYATLFSNKESNALLQMKEITKRYDKLLNIVHVGDKSITPEMLNVKKEWEEEYPEAIITIEPGNDVEDGLIDYCTKNNIDVLGLVHRELSSLERLFTINHSKRLLSNGNIALLVFQESK